MPEFHASKFMPNQLFRKPGDRIVAEDWNMLVSELERLGSVIPDQSDENSFKGPLTIEGALQIGGDLNVTGTVKATRFEGDGSGLTGISAGSENGASKWAEGTEGAIYYSRGNVGIGIDQPSSKLEVTGTVKATRFEGDGSGLTGISAGGGNGAGDSKWTDEGADGAIYYSNGNVGIGTNKPGQPLVVNRIAKASKHEGNSMEGGGDLAIVSSSPQIDFVDTNNNDWSIHVNSNKMYFVREPWNFSDLVLDGTGNIGIGTDVPGAKLQIINAAQDANGNTLILGPTNAGNLRLGYDKNYSWIQSHGSKPLAINPIGNNVGIGTNNPGAKLEVKGGQTKLEQENWKAPKFENGWVNYSSTYNAAGYFKDSLGIVHLRGLVKSGRDVIFTLPEGYIPTKRELQAVQTNNNTIGRVDILTNGQVLVVKGDPGWVSLDGITFMAK